jgi:hypothetical protein
VGPKSLLLSALATPTPDIVALAAMKGGDGILKIPETNGTGLFAVATEDLRFSFDSWLLSLLYTRG